MVSTADGQVVLTAADLTNATFQPVVTSSDGGPNFGSSADFGNYDNNPRPGGINFPGDYRHDSDLYSAPGEFPQRGLSNSDGHFVPYQYKVAGGVGGPPGAPNANHINSPDSGIGDAINASK